MIRLSKLLANDFSSIDEPVIVESPFTQVTTNGIGIRQYQIGLTASKMLFACDDFEHIDLKSFNYHSDPPESATLTLVGLMPLHELQIHFYLYNGRQIMRINTKADADDSIFLEIGGHLYRALLWNTFWAQISTLRSMVPRKFLFSSENLFLEKDEPEI